MNTKITKNISSFIAFVIASLLVCTTLALSMFNSNMLNNQGEIISTGIIEPVKYAGYGLLATLTLLVTNNKAWIYSFIILLLIAQTSLVQFCNYTYSIGIIGFIEIELTSLILLIIHIRCNDQVLRLLFPKNKTPALNKNIIDEKLIFHFKWKFQNKTKDQLLSIIDKNELVPEAIEASKRLLNEKHTK